MPASTNASSHLTSLILLIVGLSLFFVSVMTNLHIDRQSEAIAIMRSRGASRLQIFFLFVTQSTGLGLIALLVGPLLAIIVVQIISQRILSPADQGSLNIVTGDPIPIAQALLVRAAFTIIIAIITMVISIASAMRQDVLSMRRELARSTRRPLWQLLHLDAAAIVIALTGYGMSVYVAGSGILNAHVRVLVLPPLTIVGALFLALGGMLLLLRCFPLLLRFGAWIAIRGRSAPSMLAFAQMARAPRQSLRTTMLLAFSIASIIFTMIFVSTQSQRILDVAAYQVGSDFNGTFSNLSASVVQSSTYQKIPGVISASVGYTSTPYGTINNQDFQVELRAMDANTFAQTAIWTEQDSSQPLAP